ncbi:snapalysin family zinc-dependent metalloprotease [Kutzneria viridogrisea]|uniref:Extracellular small neutral protease n=2 Tax=Kutzneria TaxID=43356 RepID=W5WL61_9PSEU|nr:snapalysin family zinc-dependent metalloprotease [Kutzneria albida]AHH98909.1 hypothetical protein KALB_5547 [Kutzneria albida DSM 43870]MBA8923536.1 snapalysin [Kutzneria viridogrisea]
MSLRTLAIGAASVALLATPLLAPTAVAATDSSALRTTTVYYDTSGAPTFRDAIRAGAANWNAAVRNVQLKESSSGATLRYTEGNDSRGSYANTNGHGRGTIFIDYTQAKQYDKVRITAHETGHALGLPDHYSGPCSELMSGGGPGTSCHNSRPNSAEAARVEQNWANGLTVDYAPSRIYADSFPVLR